MIIYDNSEKLALGADNVATVGSFEEVIHAGLKESRHFGLDYNASTVATLSPENEYRRWREARGYSIFFAKSLYAIALRQWMSVFRDHFGEEHWKDHMMILDSDSFRSRKQETYEQVLDFVGLPPYEEPDVKTIAISMAASK